MLGVKYQKIYHAIHCEVLKAGRRGTAWVLHIDAIEEYKKTLKTKDRKKR